MPPSARRILSEGDAWRTKGRPRWVDADAHSTSEHRLPSPIRIRQCPGEDRQHRAGLLRGQEVQRPIEADLVAVGQAGSECQDAVLARPRSKPPGTAGEVSEDPEQVRPSQVADGPPGPDPSLSHGQEAG